MLLPLKAASMAPPPAASPPGTSVPGATDALAALKAASDACHAAPSRPEAHYAYGQAWSALGNHPNAERAFAAALQLAPRWPEAWVNYGLARYRQGHIEDAKTAMRQALLSAPGHPAAAANLGAFMRITGEVEAGEALLRDNSPASCRRCGFCSAPARAGPLGNARLPRPASRQVKRAT